MRTPAAQFLSPTPSPSYHFRDFHGISVKWISAENLSVRNCAVYAQSIVDLLIRLMIIPYITGYQPGLCNHTSFGANRKCIFHNKLLIQ